MGIALVRRRFVELEADARGLRRLFGVLQDARHPAIVARRALLLGMGRVKRLGLETASKVAHFFDSDVLVMPGPIRQMLLLHLACTFDRRHVQAELFFGNLTRAAPALVEFKVNRVLGSVFVNAVALFLVATVLVGRVASGLRPTLHAQSNP